MVAPQVFRGLGGASWRVVMTHLAVDMSAACVASSEASMRSRKLSCPYLSAYKQVLEQIQGLNYEGLGCHTQRVPYSQSVLSMNN